jgi:hypothetical protein
MNTTHDWLPKNHEALFNQGMQTWNYLSGSVTRDRMGFGAGTPQGNWLDGAFWTKLSAFTLALNNWRNPAERTPMKTFLLEETEKAFREVYRQLYTGLMKNSPLVTDEDLLAMGLPTRHGGGGVPTPVAKTYPWTKVEMPLIRRLSVDYGGAEASHAKPAGQHGMELVSVISDTKPASVDELTHSHFDTRTPMVLEFTEEERGKTFWYAVRWENTRGEKGPWSEIMSAIIP